MGTELKSKTERPTIPQAAYAGSIEAIPYDPELDAVWDQLVARSRNGCFKHTRRFLAYHGNRFRDRSLIFSCDGKPVAAIALHEDNEEWVSHRGLPFGGLIASPELTAAQTFSIFSEIERRMRAAGIYALRYTPTPQVYHTHPFEDDVFVLHGRGARVDAMKLSARARLPGLTLMQERMRKYLRQAVPQITVDHDVGLEEFWGRLTAYLEWRHEAMPTHSYHEIADLMLRFPENIKLLAIRGGDGRIVAGSLLFLTQHVIRLQYGFGGADPASPKCAVLALDAAAIERYGKGRDWIDFGTSMSPLDGTLDLRLHSQKERSGARGMRVETWLWKIERNEPDQDVGNYGAVTPLIAPFTFHDLSVAAEFVPQLLML